MTSDEQEIRSVIEMYVSGFNHGDRTLLMSVLHPSFISAGFIDGKLRWDSAEEFAAYCEVSASDRDWQIPQWEIESLLVSGLTALAIVLDCRGGLRFRDSLTLLKYRGRWQIVFKVFHGAE